jgi:hypothetical protein
VPYKLIPKFETKDPLVQEEIQWELFLVVLLQIILVDHRKHFLVVYFVEKFFPLYLDVPLLLESPRKTQSARLVRPIIEPTAILL